MASNGSTSISVTAYDTLKFSWVQVGQSVANNYTTINWSLQLISGSAGQIISSVAKDWSVTINGTTYTGTNSVAIGNNATKTLASEQVTIAHNSDGSKNFSYSFSQEFNITFAGVYIVAKTGSGTGTLNTIPRATTPTLSASSIDIGGTVTISTIRASANFTHDLAYSFAGSTYKTIQSNVATSHDWVVPTDLADSIPNTTSGTVTIRCITKNGSTVVGTKTTLLTVKVPTSAVPKVNYVTYAETNEAIKTTYYGVYIQSKSKIKVTISAVGSMGSDIKSYSSTFAGKTYTGNEWTSDTIAQSGALSIVTTITDTRGRTAKTTTSLNVLSYTPPQITAFSVARYNDKGEADPSGTKVKITLAYNVTSLNNKNIAKAVIKYKQNNESAWTTLSTRTELSLNTTISPTTEFTTDYQFDFQVSLNDDFNIGSPITYTTFIPSGEVILDIRADGKGIAFFKTSTKEGVEIAGELPGSAISLTTNANLNNLTKPGFYVIPTTAISSTVTNKPYTDSATASIKVEQTGTGMYKQILQKSTKDNGVIYERGYDSSGWGAWSIVYAGAGKVLWSGNYVMNGTQSISLSEGVSQQQHGIVLVFSRYATSGVQNYAYSCHFVSKVFVSTAGGTDGVNMNLIMATTKFDYVTGKTLTIKDTSITGHADNIATGTTSGVTFNNDKFALRYVIGV